MNGRGRSVAGSRAADERAPGGENVNEASDANRLIQVQLVTVGPSRITTLRVVDKGCQSLPPDKVWKISTHPASLHFA